MKMDILCLHEIKCEGDTLEFNLKRLSSNHTWYHSDHEAGKGGIVIGIANSYSKDVLDVISAKSWACVKLGGELNLNLISVYSPCGPRERASVWEEIASLSGNCIVCGDFNMVEW